MSDSLAKNLVYKAKAIILISGVAQESPSKLIEGVLSTYALRVDDLQEILMEGRYIGAFAISFDPAHTIAIEDELRKLLKERNLDIALEVL